METPLPSLSQLTPNLPSAAAVSSAIPPAVKTGVLQQQIDGSPRAVSNDTGGNVEPLSAVPGAKLRLMCSFGGHIMPRPHDKALTYSGGETRLVVVDRRASLVSLRSRLSSMLLNGRSFTLKYQLPSEDLDSLVTITTDEDLEHMIEEYDRAASLATATQRIRLFLFANQLETAATMGSLLDGAKSDTWFVDALNQSGLLPRGLSDSAAVNCALVNLDDSSGGEVEIQNLETNIGGGENNKPEDLLIPHQEMHISSMPDSPMVEATGSSIGSSSSSHHIPNLPPIRVNLTEEQRIEEQLAQMSFSNVHTHRHSEDGIGLMTNRPTMIPLDAPVGYNNNNTPVNGLVSISNGQVSPDEDRSDPGLSNGYKKPPLPMQPLAIPPRGAGGYGLTSPDSVASDTSNSSATSFLKPTYYQDQGQPFPRAPPTQPETTSAQPGAYTTMDQHLQQPFVHQGVRYIPHPTLPSQYIAVYPHQQQNYYLVPVSQSQQQYVQAGTPPLYPNTKPAPTNARPEAAHNVYHPSLSQIPQVLQQQPQYMGYSGIPHHTVNTNLNHGGAYEYYNHAQGPPPNTAIPLASQYHSMTPAAAAAALKDMSNQMAALDSSKHQQHMAVSQPH